MYKTQLYILTFCSFSPANVTIGGSGGNLCLGMKEVDTVVCVMVVLLLLNYWLLSLQF